MHGQPINPIDGAGSKFAVMYQVEQRVGVDDQDLMGHLGIALDGLGGLLQHVKKMAPAQIAHLASYPVLTLLQIVGGFVYAQ